MFPHNNYIIQFIKYIGFPAHILSQPLLAYHHYTCPDGHVSSYEKNLRVCAGPTQTKHNLSLQPTTFFCPCRALLLVCLCLLVLSSSISKHCCPVCGQIQVGCYRRVCSQPNRCSNPKSLIPSPLAPPKGYQTRLKYTWRQLPVAYSSIMGPIFWWLLYVAIRMGQHCLPGLPNAPHSNPPASGSRSRTKPLGRELPAMAKPPWLAVGKTPATAMMTPGISSVYSF